MICLSFISVIFFIVSGLHHANRSNQRSDKMRDVDVINIQNRHNNGDNTETGIVQKRVHPLWLVGQFFADIIFKCNFSFSEKDFEVCNYDESILNVVAFGTLIEVGRFRQ